MSEINETCKDCSLLTDNIIDGITPVCGFALDLGHWSDAKNYCRDGNIDCNKKVKKEAKKPITYYRRERIT